jgi:hypothetical protein
MCCEVTPNGFANSATFSAPVLPLSVSMSFIGNTPFLNAPLTNRFNLLNGNWFNLIPVALSSLH